MPIYKGRRPGTYRVVVWSRGKPHEAIVEGKRSDARTYEARRKLELDASGRRATRSVLTFSELCLNHYRPHAIRHLKASTWHKVRRYQVATLIEFFGPTRTTELSTEQVEAFKDHLHGKASSRNNLLRVLRTIVNWARDTGFPIAELKIRRLPERGDGRVKVWTETEVQKLLAVTRDRAPQLVPMFIFLLNTGCRKGEALACEWSWIDFPGAMIRIPSNEYWQPKNGKPREVPMADAVRAILQGEPEHGRWVFPSRLDERYTDFPKDLYWECRDAAGLTGGPHTFRHTYASHFLRAVPDLFLLAKVLGHSHQRVTELYTHLLPDHLSRARNAVNISPGLRTMARTMAAPSRTRKTAGKK